ncbi:DNA topoisomerase III [Campylobacter coli]|nr:DNA topoisomerase III [Campylobacter coli]
MRLFIAEKPELGRAIAEGLDGNYKSGEGYIQKGDNIVTWAFGHILKLAEPKMYNEKFKKWKIIDLPLELPYPFKRIPIENSKFQLAQIIKLIKDDKVDEIIHCGDADEEGQILIDEIIEYSKTKKPVNRCLINDITPQAIKKAIANIKPNSNFKGMSESGFARAEADFIVGVNLTRFYSILNSQNGGEKEVISVGRVQTPILSLIVKRQLEFQNHISKPYFLINANFNINNNLIKIPLKVDENIEDENLAKNIKQACEGKNANLFLNITQKLEYPPLAYNLLNLQAEASKLYGFSASKTLEITQKLREIHKAISYNRSDCEYLPESIFLEAPKIVEAIEHNFKEDVGQNNINLSIKSRAFDDSKLSAHYGIIPTQNQFDILKLTNEQKIIYTLIVKRFLMQFYEPCKYDSYLLELKIKDYVFSKTIRIDTELGFKKYFKNLDENIDENENFIKNIKNGDLAKCENILINQEKTKPKPLYTMTTLLKDLNKVSKYVDDEKIKKLLLEKDKDKKGESGGIGTPATRSAHIETLINREYISVSKDKKQIINATAKGIKLIENIDSALTKLDMTALWFEAQKDIEKNKLRRKDFLDQINNFVKEIILKNKEKELFFSQNTNKIKTNRIICPKCEKGNLREIDGKFGKFFSCSEYQNGCDYKAKSINGKPVENTNQTSNFKCPKCEKGNLIRRESKNEKNKFWYGCSEWKNGCSFMCPEKDKKPNLNNFKENQ